MADIFDTVPEELSASMLKATSTDPEAHAKVLDLSRRLNLPPEVVAINPGWAQHQADMQIDAEKISTRYPATAKYLSDPNRAAVSRDEIMGLMATEDTIRNSELINHPGLFGKDVRDTLVKQLREKGHDIQFAKEPDLIDLVMPEATTQAYLGDGVFVDIPQPQLTPEQQSEQQDKKAVKLYETPQGFFERMITGTKNLEPVPFAGSVKEGFDVYELTQLANRVKDGTADDKDWIELLKYDSEIRRGTDFGGKVAAVLVNLPAFAGEITATGGVYTAGSAAARKTGLYAAKKILNKSAREVAESAVLRGTVKAAGWVAGSIVQSTVGMPHRVAVDTMRRLMPQLGSMTVNDQGEIEKTVTDPEDGFATALTKAIVSQGIEVGTERAGGFISKVTGLEALKAAVMTNWFKIHPTSALSQFFAKLRKVKWDGVLEEFGEERLGELLRAATGLESLKLDPEQYAVELVSFAALPLAGGALYAPSMVRQSRQAAARAEQQVEFFRDLGKQSVESKTRIRVGGMLGTLGDMAAQDGPVERLFAPIVAWDQHFTSKGIDPRQAAQETLGSTEAYDKAREAGHDLEIPLGAYVEKLAPTEHNEALAQVMRLGSADAPNVVEMRAGMQATEARVAEMLQLNQDYTALTTEQQTLTAELSTLQEQVQAAQAQAEQRTARVQEIQAQLQAQAPQAMQEILAGNAPAAEELQGLVQEYQSLTAQDQQTQQAAQRITEIQARQQEITKEISRIEKRNAEARRSAPGQEPEVVTMAGEVYDQLMATGNTSDRVARAHSNMFARMAYIMANRAGMNLQEFKDRFVTRILGDKTAAPAGVTLSQEEQQRDAEYMAAVEAGDMEAAQRLVDDAAKAAGYTVGPIWHGTATAWTTPRTPLFLGDEQTAKAYAKERSYQVGDNNPDGEVIVKVYANFQNSASEDDVKRIAGKLGIDVENDQAFSVLDPGIAGEDKSSAVISALQAEGFDSAKIEDFSPESFDGTQSYVAFEPSQLKSADPVTRDADGNVIPLSERFNPEQESILYQSAPTEGVLAAAPTITLQDLVGKAVFPIIADLTSAGQMYTGIDSTQIAVPIYTQGGPKFPLLPENQQAGVAWASQGTHVATSKAKLAGQSVLGVVVAMSQEAHKSNATVISSILSTVQAYVGAGRMSDEQVAALDELIRTQGPIAEKKAMDEAQSELAKAQSKLKKAKTPKDINAANKAIADAQAKVADANPGDKSLSKWPGFGNAQAASEFIDRNKTTFGQRQRLADVIALKEAQAFGTPNVEAILNELRDKDYDNMEWGDSIMVIEFDKNDSLVRLGTDGTKEHMSYEWGIRGKVVGKLARPVNYTLIWDDFFKERRAQHSKFMEAARKEAKRLKKDFLNLTDDEFKKIKKTLEEKQELKPALEGDDRRSFELKKPVQVITQEIADRIPQTPHTAIKSSKHAQLVNAFINDQWMSTDVAVKAGGLGPSVFLNALAADPNKVLLDEYTLKSINEAKKENGLRIFQLGKPRDMPGVKKENTSKVFFGLKNGDPASGYGLDPAAHGFGPNEKMLTLVLNGERKAPGMIAAIMIKALEEGATSLDCFAVPSKKYPTGFLPSLYEQFGFEVVGTVPFDEKQHSATKLADMKKLWKDAGWDESLGYPPIVLMKWRGTDEQRKGLKEHYLREGTTSFLPGGNPGANTAAAGDIRRDVGATDGQAGRGPDGGRVAGDERTSVRLSDSSRKLAGAVAELKELTPLELQNLGILSASQAEEAIRKAKEKAESQPVFPEITLNQTAAPAGMSAPEIAEWAASHSIDEIRNKLADMRLTPTPRMLEMLGDFPEYLNPVVDFVMTQRRKLAEGKITPREVAKAYYITLASIGADAIGVDTIRARADEIGLEFNPDPMFLSKGAKGQDIMRPEELAAWWFSTPMGQRALNAIEKGTVDREAWEQGLAIRDAFGRNDARERTSKSGAYAPGMIGEQRKKKNLNDILALTEEINATKGDTDKLQQVLNSLQGIGNGKKGFIGHMLGMGSVATIDAVEINVWLTGAGDTSRLPVEMKKRVALAKAGGTQVDAFYERIRQRIRELHKQTKDRTNIPDEVAAHIVHHWIWDTAKNAQTTHAGVYEAMRLYQNADYRPGVLTEAAQKFKAGEITREEYNRIAAVELPLKPFDAVPKPATMDEVRTGLGEYKAGTRLKRDMAQAPESIPAQTLESRLDIPAYREKGVWVVTLHEDRGDKSKGSAASPIAYTSTAVLNNVTFKVHEQAALNIATGKPKGTIATMRGDYQPMSAEQAQVMAEQAMQDGWVQVGMNPLRHSYFYDKADERPVVSAEQVLQIGGLVLAKNPVYGNAQDNLFQRAFHGSPYRFEKFMLDHIGTGEGEQAFGWGLYFAGNREVAEFYRETLGGVDLQYADETARAETGKLMPFGFPDPHAVLKSALGPQNDVAGAIKYLRSAWPKDSDLQAHGNHLADLLESGRVKPEFSGQLYEVEIPENDVLLDWDQPVPEEIVRKVAEKSVEMGIVKNVDEAVEMITDEYDRNGQLLYRGISDQLGGDREASLFFNSIGIKGIRYLDGGSRDAGEGTHNFVIFDDAAVQMLNTFYQNEDNARGSISFNPAQRGAPRREFTVRMLKKANASTFMHEAAHFYLEVFNDLAVGANAPAALREDWDKISKWLGLQAGMPITVDQHETFARGFERYLMEGKAPAEELREFFASMRRWLVRIYLDISDKFRGVFNLNVEISDEIRGVFDRMVATDVEIQAAQAREKVEPMFGSKPDDMEEAAWERYRKAVEKTSIEARERLQTELQKEILKAQSAERKAEIERVTKQVSEELAATREHIALAILRAGKMPDDREIPAPLMPMKLDKDSLLSAGLDKGTLDALRRLGVYRVEGGVSVDVAAEVLGFGSVDELVQALVTTKPFDKAVKEETMRRVDESHPSMMADSEELKRAASEAVRNEYRDDVIAYEVQELQRLIRKDKEAVGRVADMAPPPLGAIARRILRSGTEQANAARVLLDNSKLTVDFFKQIALKTAQEQLAGMRLRDIRPSLYLAAARSAGARASRLAAAGDFQAALGQKEAELLNHILYRESRAMQKDAQKQQRYLLRMTEDAARERLGKASPSYREQVDQLLERFNFIPIPLTQVDRRARFADWITEQEKNGFTVSVDPNVRDDAFRKDFREMTASELTAVYDAVKQIDHLAKLKNKLLTLQDEREFRAVVQELVAQITSNTKAKPRAIGSKTTGEKIAEGWDSFFAAHRKLASLVREMDGFVDQGPVYKAIMAPINAAADAEAVETEKATEALQKLFKVFSKDDLKKMTRKQVVRGATKNFNLSKEDRLAIALNWGNEDNRQKLIDGYNGLNEQDVLAILDTLEEKDWKFVQSVWDYIDSFWPRIRDKQERVYGLPPEKVEPTPVVTKFGVFRGGYYPLHYAGSRAEGESDADAAKMMMRGALTASTTRRGHTEGRKEGVERPVKVELGVITQHLTQVIHDLTHHEMLIDVNRLLRNRSIMEAMEEHYGEPVYRQFRKALEAIAVGNTNSEDRFTRVMGHLRTGASVAGLGFNLMTSMMQAFGLINAIPRVGAVNMAKAVGRWLGSRSDMEDSVAWIYERSDMMRLRGKTMNRELNEIRNTVDPKFQTALMDSYFYLIQKGQMLADVPTWLGAYHKAMDANMSEAEAVQVADQTVIDTQGGGMVKDLANVQRGGPLLKMWTTFYSYFNALWNMNAETINRTNFKSPTDMGRMMVDLLILNSLPVAIQYALVNALRGGSGDDDDEWYKALAKQQMSYFLAQLVFVRELGGIMDGRNYEGPAGARFFAESYKLARQVEQGEADRGFWVAANKVGGIVFHYPAVQLQRTVEGMKSLWEGRTSNPAVLIVGPSKEER